MSYGFVYVARNESMPGLYKIGITSNSPALRMKKLSSPTAVPSIFELMGYSEVCEPMVQERLIPLHLSEYRENKNREFFKLTPGALVELEWTLEIIGSSFWVDVDAFVDEHHRLLVAEAAEESE